MTPRLYIHKPKMIFEARVDLTSPEYPLTLLPYKDVTLAPSDMSDIRPGLTVMLGDPPGLHGRQRIRDFSALNTLRVGRSSRGTFDGELWAIDNTYVRVYEDMRVWTKPPVFVGTGSSPTQFKDAVIGIGNYWQNQPPVANAGPGTMGTIDPSTSRFTVAFDGAGSFAVADGATITGYGWTIGDGTLVSGTLSTPQMSASFPAGFRYVSLSVTDSNGLSHITYVPVLAIDPANDPTFSEFEAVQRLTVAGQEVEFSIYSDVPASEYPDGTLVMFASGEPASASDRSHMQFIGWHQSDPTQIRAGRVATLADTTLRCVDVAGRMKDLRAYSVVIENEAFRDTDIDSVVTWDYMQTPNIDKFLHFLLHWHSNVLDVADWQPSGTWSNFPFRVMAAEGANLYDQVNGVAQRMTPDHLLTCNRRGQLFTKPDLMLQAPHLRVYSGVDLHANDMADIRWTARAAPTTYELLTTGVLVTTADEVDPVGSIAPGHAPGAGVGRVEVNEKIAQTQELLNAVEGRRYARLNAPTSHFEIELAGGDDQGIEPADVEEVSIELPASVAAQRGLTLGNELGMVHEMTIRHRARREAYVRDVSFAWERPVNAADAETFVPPQPDNDE